MEGYVERRLGFVEPMHLQVAAHQQRDHLDIEFHQGLGGVPPAALCHRLDPFAHAGEIDPVLVPAVEVEQAFDLLRSRHREQVAGVGAADFLKRVEERFRREGLHQALGFGCGKYQIALLARG